MRVDSTIRHPHPIPLLPKWAYNYQRISIATLPSGYILRTLFPILWFGEVLEDVEDGVELAHNQLGSRQKETNQKEEQVGAHLRKGT